MKINGHNCVETMKKDLQMNRNKKLRLKC